MAYLMTKRSMILLKGIVHLLCLLPFIDLLHLYQNGVLALDPDPVARITHFTGNWALWMLLVSLAITPVRRLSPRIAWLIRFRRLIGLYAFFYASLHLATYIFLFSGYDLPSVLTAVRTGHPGAIFEEWKRIWPTIWDDVRKRRFIQVGFLAWVILLTLAITSPTFLLRAMGGRNWQRLHRLIYVAAVAAVIHYWWLVKTGVRTPWKVTAVLVVLFLARLIYSAIRRPGTRVTVYPARH